MTATNLTVKDGSYTAPGPGFYVPSPCGRAWFVPLEKVGQDYAEFLKSADKLTAEEAKVQAEAYREHWVAWFNEQCNFWCDIDRLGTVVRKSTLFKTKRALDRRRGIYGRSWTDCEYLGDL